MASHLDDFVIGRGAPHPAVFVLQFKKLFRVVSALLHLQPGLKDFLNEKFFTKEAGTDIGSWLSAIDSFLLSAYDHRDIAGQMRMIDGILGTMRALMAFLSKTRPISSAIRPSPPRRSCTRGRPTGTAISAAAGSKRWAN